MTVPLFYFCFALQLTIVLPAAALAAVPRVADLANLAKLKANAAGAAVGVSYALKDTWKFVTKLKRIY